ncbi:hypothetical protein AgCh_019356 [Apium graveolens]
MEGLDYESINENVKKAQYAVRGKLYLRASEERKECLIIFTVVGNPHAPGQKPLTYFRQVVALCQAPFLLDDPNVGLVFSANAIARAEYYLGLTSGGLGACSDSRGLPGNKERSGEFIEKHDGYPREVLAGGHLGYVEVQGVLRDVLSLNSENTSATVTESLLSAFLIGQPMNGDGESDRELKAYCPAFDNELGSVPIADVRSSTHCGEPCDGYTRFF